MRSADIHLAVILLATAGSARAQDGPPAPPPAHVDPSRIAPSSQKFKMIAVREGAELEVGTIVNSVALADVQGAPSLVWMQAVTNARGTMLDSSVADRATLRPRTHRSTSSTRIMRLDFSPGLVVGKDSASGSAPEVINEKVGDEIYDSAMLDVLVAALPLAAGYKARLPVFLWEAGGAIDADITVTGSEMVGKDDTWTVIVTLKDRPAHFNVTKKNPRVVEILSSPAPGIQVKMIRTGP